MSSPSPAASPIKSAPSSSPAPPPPSALTADESNASWQSVVVSAAAANSAADAVAAQKAGFVPTSTGTSAAAASPPPSSSPSASTLAAAPLETPWSRWAVEARLMDRLLPAERKHRQARINMAEDNAKYHMAVPKSPFPIMSPEQATTTPLQQQQQRQPTGSASCTTPSARLEANEAENFQLRERVQLLESELNLHRARGDKNAKRRRHQQIIAQTLERKTLERFVQQFWHKWNRFLRSRERAATAALQPRSSKTGAAAKKPSSPPSLRNVWGTPRGGGGTTMTSPPLAVDDCDVAVNNGGVQGEAHPHTSPYSRVNASVAAEVQQSVQRRHVTTSPLRGAAGDLNQTNSSSRSAAKRNRDANEISAADEEERDEAAAAGRSVLERRIEQLTLRCMDQDEVIRTLFVELAAVGQELEKREAFVSPAGSSMLLRQAVDAPDHAQVRSVVSPWPRLPSQTPPTGLEVGALPATGSTAVSVGRMMSDQDAKRRQVMEEKHNEFAQVTGSATAAAAPSPPPPDADADDQIAREIAAFAADAEAHGDL